MNIVIAGGGTAGWLAALIISKRKPQHKITLVESSTIGIIGAGEGSTGTMTNIIQNITFDYGCNESDFVKSCDVTAKLGIKFVDWSGDKNYYISPITGSYTAHVPVDYAFHHVLSNMPKNKLHVSSENGLLIENNKDTLTTVNGPAAYHFDAHKVGQYFKKICGDKINHVESEITEVMLTENGSIKSLKLSNGSEIFSDFFIDATGFSRKLISSIGAKWYSYKKYLPVDRAMPFITKYDPSETIQPVTVARAQQHGWMWQIPLLRRKGCGYVYSSEYVTDADAQKELEINLGHEVDPIKIIKFDSGRLENLWIKNCLAVGLSAAFAEPLEATSIHTTILQLENFAMQFLEDTSADTVVESKVDAYNETFGYMYDLLKDFLVLHYKTKRADTEFWKYVNSDESLTDFTREILEISKIRSPTPGNFPPIVGSAGWPLWSFILGGTGNLAKEISSKELKTYRMTENARMEFFEYQIAVESKIRDISDNTSTIRSRQKVI